MQRSRQAIWGLATFEFKLLSAAQRLTPHLQGSTPHINDTVACVVEFSSLMMAGQAKVTRFCPGASKRVTSESNSGLQLQAQRDLKDVTSGEAQLCHSAGAVLQFAGLEVTLPVGVQAAQQGDQCLTLCLSDGASIILRAGERSEDLFCR